MIDAVLSFHTNPERCGVAKFNKQLADRLGVPLENIGQHPFAHPLISIKSEEALDWMATASWYRRYSLFFHDKPFNYHRDTVMKASAVYAGNREIAAAIRPHRPDVIEAFCPSTLDGNADRGLYRVLTFGMVHKVAVQQFTQLKARLDAEHPDYTVSLSAGRHEGTDYDRAFDLSVKALRGIFGPRLCVLGFLSDDALARELYECDAVAVFFDPALRANNTSAWAALSAGKTLYTNTDEFSPPLDVSLHTWDRLLERMGVGVAV